MNQPQGQQPGQNQPGQNQSGQGASGASGNQNEGRANQADLRPGDAGYDATLDPSSPSYDPNKAAQMQSQQSQTQR